MGLETCQISAAAITHRGKVANKNQDSIGMLGWMRNKCMNSPVVMQCMNDEQRLFIVADGLGGHVGGEVASALVVQSLNQAAEICLDESSLGEVLATCNRQLYDAMYAMPELRGMGSTVVGMLVTGNDVYVFNCGDSRAYCNAGKYLRLLSIDDKFNFGRSDTTERTGTQGHSVTQVLGGSSQFQEISPHITKVSLDHDLRLLLCSDGLTDMLDQNQMEELLSADPYASVQNLFGAAMASGGTDNISIVLADFLKISDQSTSASSEQLDVFKEK